MKVLQINSVCGIRSTGRICTDIAQVLEAAGHDCKIAYGREQVPLQHQKYAYRITNIWGNRLDGLKARIFDNAGFNSVGATKRLVRWMKEYDPDVIHLHNLHGYYVNIELLFQALKEMDKPVIWTLHDCWSFTGHCAHFSVAKCEKWKDGCYCCPLTRVYPVSFGYDRSKKNYAAKKSCFTGIKNMTIVTPSQWLADLVKQSFLKEYEVRVIPNGIDRNVFQPAQGDFRREYGISDKKMVLAVASAWGKNKGLYDLFKLADLLGDEYRVVIVGLRPEQLKLVPENVTAITRTNNTQELAHIYTTADIFVNPTYQDTYPTVNLEAQACGTPVITYQTGGSVESVPGANVVEQGNIEALAAAVRADSCDLKEDLLLDKREMLKQYFDAYRMR